MLEPLYYTVGEIKVLEHCGRDKAYEIAKSLPHEKRGRDIYVFREDYNKHYQDKRNKAIENQKVDPNKSKVFQIRKFS